MSNLVVFGIDVYLFKKIVDVWKNIHSGSGGGGGGSGGGGSGGHHHHGGGKGPIITPPPLNPYGLEPVVMGVDQETALTNWYKDFGSNNIIWDRDWQFVQGPNNNSYGWTLEIQLDDKDPNNKFNPVNVSSVIMGGVEYPSGNLVGRYVYSSLDNPWMLWPGINYPENRAAVCYSKLLFDME